MPIYNTNVHEDNINVALNVAKTVGAAMKHYMPQEQQNTFKGSNESPYKLKGIWKWPAQSTNSTKSFFQYNHYF